MQLTIKNLRQNGFKVRVHQFRNYDYVIHTSVNGDPSLEKRVSCKGGKTVIDVTSTKYNITTSGVSECSKKESFNRKLGNSIALGRAVRALGTCGVEI